MAYDERLREVIARVQADHRPWAQARLSANPERAWHYQTLAVVIVTAHAMRRIRGLVTPDQLREGSTHSVGLGYPTKDLWVALEGLYDSGIAIKVGGAYSINFPAYPVESLPIE